MMTLQELEEIRAALLPRISKESHRWVMVPTDHAVEIINREIDEMKQHELLSESKANPT